jgi:1-deoxy-D-xylulose-5-phosphate reductoisomerase
VAAFLKREIGFTDIPKVVERTMNETPACRPESIEEVLAIDSQARSLAQEQLPRQVVR